MKQKGRGSSGPCGGLLPVFSYLHGKIVEYSKVVLEWEVCRGLHMSEGFGEEALN
jgi:hypothetical protein